MCIALLRGMFDGGNNHESLLPSCRKDCRHRFCTVIHTNTTSGNSSYHFKQIIGKINKTIQAFTETALEILELV